MFHDPDAPTEQAKLDPKEVERIETEHEAGKKGHIDDLIRRRLNVTIPTVTPEGESGNEELEAERADLTEEAKAAEEAGETIDPQDLADAIEMLKSFFPEHVTTKVTEEDVKAAEGLSGG
ncbi:hypothetical protein OG894_44495 (plasmid) [Streptomyces sp. NBC_01724]|uniref:hypothetical protein n=1 Tax=Streptomyces sp. NBC_01724 TaxID=2975922 RepID=UPI002E326811|nr:hypothetical protein [Streptomyces sp. NBC_01724]